LLKFLKISCQKADHANPKTDNSVDDFLIESVDKFIIPAIYFTILYLGIKTLDLSIKFDNTLRVVYHVILTYYGIKMISNTVRIFLQSYVRKQENGRRKSKADWRNHTDPPMSSYGQLAFYFYLTILGYNVTAIVTGMGIGGIAIALAAQNILGDLLIILLSSLTVRLKLEIL
jgi:hypothetical protein